MVPAFAAKVTAFLDALHKAGALVTISATYRPPERAWLMHYAYEIAHKKIAPGAVPVHDGIDINWLHLTNGKPDLAASILAAKQMVAAYGIRHEPVLISRHTEGRAIDMTIDWKGKLKITDAGGVVHTCATQEDLWPVGESYGVMKLKQGDPPHWSDDGH